MIYILPLSALSVKFDNINTRGYNALMSQLPERQHINPELIIPPEIQDIIMGDKTLYFEFSRLLTNARTAETWSTRLYLLFPCLNELEGKYRTEIGSMSVEPFPLSEAEIDVLLQDEATSKTRLFWFAYSELDHPDLVPEFGGIKKGITIREHTDPAHHEWTDEVKREKWSDPLDLKNPLFEQVTAMSLAGNLGQLISYHESHINTLIKAYTAQKGLVL